jgi:hypothetical protein
MISQDLLQAIDRFHKFATSIPLPEILKELSSLETFKDRVAYAEKHLKHLSSGSSRVIYITSDNQVLKLAKNERGIAQNIAEGNPKMVSKYINKTTKQDKDGIWKISPFLDKITEKEFQQMVGIPFKHFSEAISYGLQDVSGNSHPKPEGFEAVAKTDLYQELVEIGERFHLMGGDLGRVSSWGREDDHPVLLDAGLNRQIYDFYYDTGRKAKSTKSK